MTPSDVAVDIDGASTMLIAWSDLSEDDDQEMTVESVKTLMLGSRSMSELLVEWGLTRLVKLVVQVGDETFTLTQEDFDR